MKRVMTFANAKMGIIVLFGTLHTYNLYTRVYMIQYLIQYNFCISATYKKDLYYISMPFSRILRTSKYISYIFILLNTLREIRGINNIMVSSHNCLQHEKMSTRLFLIRYCFLELSLAYFFLSFCFSITHISITARQKNCTQNDQQYFCEVCDRKGIRDNVAHEINKFTLRDFGESLYAKQ